MKIESDFDYRFEWKQPDTSGVDPRFMRSLNFRRALRIQITPRTFQLRLGYTGDAKWGWGSWVGELDDSISVNMHAFQNFKISEVLTLEEATEMAWDMLERLEKFLPLKIDRQNKKLIWLEEKGENQC